MRFWRRTTVTAGYDADPETVIRLLNASLARGDHVLMACTAVVAPDSAKRFEVRMTLGVVLAAQLGERLLAAQDSLDRRPLKLRAEYTASICLPLGAQATPAESYVPTVSSRHGEHSTATSREGIVAVGNPSCGRTLGALED